VSTGWASLREKEPVLAVRRRTSFCVIPSAPFLLPDPIRTATLTPTADTCAYGGGNANTNYGTAIPLVTQGLHIMANTKGRP